MIDHEAPPPLSAPESAQPAPGSGIEAGAEPALIGDAAAQPAPRPAAEDPAPAPVLAVGAVVRRGDDLLLIQRGREPAAGKWSIPGGRVRRGELIAAAVVRELREETGLVGVCGPLINYVERFGPGYHYVILDFHVTLLDRGNPTAGDDAADVRWVHVRDMAGMPLVEGLAEFLHNNGVIPAIA